MDNSFYCKELWSLIFSPEHQFAVVRHVSKGRVLRLYPYTNFYLQGDFITKLISSRKKIYALTFILN